MTVEEPLDKTIITDFLRAGFNITPGALSFIKQRDDPTRFARMLLNSFNCTRQRMTITREMLEKIDKAVSDIVNDVPKAKAAVQGAIPACVDGSATPGNAEMKASAGNATAAPRPKIEPIIKAAPGVLLPSPAVAQPPIAAQADAQPGIESLSMAAVAIPAMVVPTPAGDLTSKSTYTPLAKEHAARVKVIEDCTSKLKNDGEFTDFLSVFSDRFEKIKGIFKGRTDIPRITDISDLADGARAADEVFIVGMVVEKRQTKSGNTMLVIDDRTGSINVVISTKNKDPKILVNIILDEVLCFKGYNKEGFFFAADFFWPDVKRNRKPQLASEDLSIALISDIHVGSDNHLGPLWEKFKRWIRGDDLSEKAREFAGKVKYVAIAGDLVDGVGVYPSQEDHLVIKDVYKQFERVAEMLRELPDYLTFIVSPGSHEPVRRALPQPAIPKSYAPGLYDLKAIMVSDPGIVETHGIKTMLFHGESFIDLSIDIPEISNSTPEKSMEKLMTSRHLAPSFGKKTELAPDKKDWLVINEVPDILHTGHVHCNGVKMYHGTWLVNSGCFQGQTDFMKSLGIIPSPGKPNIISLKDFKLTTLNLSGVTCMVSLKPLSNEPKDVLKHVYLCLGKDKIPYQDLVFFMAFDLKLFPPSKCEKMLTAAKNEGLLDVAEGKIVTINTGLVLQKPLASGKGASAQDIVNALALNEDEITKAVKIKPETLKACSIDAKTGILTITFAMDPQGKAISAALDPLNKKLHQESDEDVMALAGKRVLLKYVLRAIILRKEDTQLLAVFGAMLANVKTWKFSYKRV